jgi:hypothetical protein
VLVYPGGDLGLAVLGSLSQHLGHPAAHLRYGLVLRPPGDSGFDGLLDVVVKRIDVPHRQNHYLLLALRRLDGRLRLVLQLEHLDGHIHHPLQQLEGVLLTPRLGKIPVQVEHSESL